jgi:hypothetical protein
MKLLVVDACEHMPVVVRNVHGTASEYPCDELDCHKISTVRAVDVEGLGELLERAALHMSMLAEREADARALRTLAAALKGESDAE